MTASPTRISTNTLEMIFTYGRTRDLYAMKEHEPLRTFQVIDQLIRPEYLPVVRNALLADQALIENKSDNQWQLALSPVSRQCVWELHCGIMIRLLETVSGLTHLLADAQCQHMRLIEPPEQRWSTTNWHDTKTELPIALYLLLGIRSGSAILCTEPDRKLVLNEPTLQMAFFRFSGYISLLL